MSGDKAVSEGNRQIFVAMLGALGAKDFAGFETYLDANVVCDWPFPPIAGFPGEMTGASTVRKNFERDMGAFTPYNYQIHKIYEQADPSLLIAEYAADCTYLPRGVRYRNKYLGIMRFANGKVTWWREYLNPLPILEVVGNSQAWSANDGLATSDLQKKP